MLLLSAPEQMAENLNPYPLHMKTFCTLLLLPLIGVFSGAAAQIKLDGTFDDWATETAAHYFDADNAPIRHLAITNDAERLYFYVQFKEPVKLYEGYFLNDTYLKIYIDADNDPATGELKDGIGADFLLDIGNKTFYYLERERSQSAGWLLPNFITMPTVTATEHEFSINRSMATAVGNVVLQPTIALVVEEGSSGDVIPNEGTLSYTFKQATGGTPDQLSLARPEKTDLRIMTYNLLHDGMINYSRREPLGRIIAAAAPDIAFFNENWNTGQREAELFMNQFVEQPGGWHMQVYGGGNITASRWPMTQHWSIGQGRQNASLVDLPATVSEQDLLVINLHLACCTNDAVRQLQVDEVIAFIKDAASAGGRIDLPEGTPIIIGGDLNLVGHAQQLVTLLAGDIVDEATFGEDHAPDWDGSAFVPVQARQTASPDIFTWYDEGSAFPPGWLDYLIYSDSRLTQLQAVILNTRTMNATQLQELQLQPNDSYASDHMPVIADFRFVNEVPAPQVPQHRVVVCDQEPAPTLTAAGESVRWYADQALLTEVATGNDFTPALPQTGVYTYWVTQQQNGIEGTPAALTVLVTPAPAAQLSGLPEETGQQDRLYPLIAYPAGGVFEGPGIVGNAFNPIGLAAGEHLISYNFSDSLGCPGSISGRVVVTEEALGLPLDKASVRVYPNPATSFISLEFKYATRGQLRLLSVVGQEVAKQSMPAQQHWRLEVPKELSGSFILEVTTEEGYFRQLVLVQ